MSKEPRSQQPQESEATSKNKNAKPKSAKGAGGLLGVLTVVVGILLVTGIGVGGWFVIDKLLLEGPRLEREAKAFEFLKSKGILVIAEPPNHEVTTIQFQKPDVEEAVFQKIPDFFRISSIKFSRTNFNDSHMPLLSGLNKMVTLSLDDTDITDAGLKHLESIKSLQTLTIAGCNVTDEGLDSVLEFPGLKILDISRTKITDAGIKKLASKDLIIHLIMDELKVSEAGLKELAKCKNLRRVSIINCGFDKEKAKAMFPGKKVDWEDQTERRKKRYDERVAKVEADAKKDAEEKAKQAKASGDEAIKAKPEK
jgi:Leucine Rich repeat